MIVLEKKDIPEDVAKFVIGRNTVIKSENLYKGYEVFYACNKDRCEGYPTVVLKKDKECFIIDVSQSEYDDIWELFKS